MHEADWEKLIPENRENLCQDSEEGRRQHGGYIAGVFGKALGDQWSVEK